jgi:hypothetical protein
MNATAFRLARHHLTRRAPLAQTVEVARRLCGVHAQVLSSADLILWARVSGYRPNTLGKALWEEGSLVKTWLMRGTLHLVPADDLALYVGALDNRGEYQPVWLRAFKVTAKQMERLIEGVADALDGECLTREELVEALGPRVGRTLAGRLRSGWGEFLKPAARRGVLCFGPSRGQNVTFVRPDRWLGRPLEPPERAEAQTELLRRFLATYGPVTPNDFERWIGALRRVREPWMALADEVEEIAPKTFVLARDRRRVQRAGRGGTVRLLPAFDPFVLQPYSARPVEAAARPRVYRTAGWVSATILVDGRVAGVWELRRQGRKLTVRLEPFAPLDHRTRAAVAREAASLARHLGGELELSET